MHQPRHTPQAPSLQSGAQCQLWVPKVRFLVSPAKHTACTQSSFGPALVTARWEGITYLEPGARLGSHVLSCLLGGIMMGCGAAETETRVASAGRPSLHALNSKPQGDSHTCTLHNPGAQLWCFPSDVMEAWPEGPRL